jgi:hypothetical protein
VQDWEADRNSPFLTGAPDAARGADHSVSLANRFRGLNATLDGQWTPTSKEWLSVSYLLAGSSNYVNPSYATNLVQRGQGFSPIVFKCGGVIDVAGNCTNPVASTGLAAKILLEAFDPLKNGLSFKLEYFNIGSEYNAIMGSRREADVLLTDGIITGGFTRGGQLPTLNIANEFVDFDEPWYESVIGWHGLTGLVEYVSGSLKATLEATGITYNTNMQNRDVKNQYPDFLYTHGFTDTTAFTSDSDYANVYDRGKDPRSVYAQFQDRQTVLSVVNVQYLLPRLPGAVVNLKGKWVWDRDNRDTSSPANRYVGRMYMGFAQISLQPTNQLKTTLGYEFSRWLEDNRDGSAQQGYYNAETRRHTARVGLTYSFGGALLSYTLEYFHKDLLRDHRAYYDMKWNVWRAKGTFEVAW